MLKWTQRDKHACSVVVMKVFDAVERKLTEISLLLESEIDPEERRASAVKETEELHKDIPALLHWKHRIFGADYKTPQKSQLEELDRIKDQLQTIARLLSQLEGTSEADLRNGLKTAHDLVHTQWEKAVANSSKSLGRVK